MSRNDEYVQDDKKDGWKTVLGFFSYKILSVCDIISQCVTEKSDDFRIIDS